MHTSAENLVQNLSQHFIKQLDECNFKQVDKS